jgi:hypothetical protein
MGFSYTLLALSKAYVPEEIDTLSDDLGAGHFRATYEASVYFGQTVPLISE